MAENQSYIDYAENLFKAIDVIATQKINEISFDTTKMCTVVDVSDSKNGHYIVSDGSIKFDAYSELTTYRYDDAVRVSIPNGDWNQKKYIIGKHITDNDMTPITYVSPLESVLSMTENLLTGTVASKEYGLHPNGAVREILIESIDLSKNEKFKQLQSSQIYDTITLKADFQSLLKNYDMRSGTYGLRLDLYVPTAGNKKQYIVKQAWLDSKEMFGNPYTFTLYSTQETKFTLNNIAGVEKIALYFYQSGTPGPDKSHIEVFKYRTKSGKLEVYPQGETNNFYPLRVKNIQIGFGTELINIEDNVLKLYTTGTPEYGLNTSTGKNYTDEKTMGISWYNKDDNHQYIGFSDGIYDPDYDELDYMSRFNTDARLTAQRRESVPTDAAGLELAADIEELVPLVQATGRLVSKDLYRALLELKTGLDDSDLADEVDLVIDGDDDTKGIVDYIVELDNQSTNKDNLGIIQQMDQYYADVLQAAANKEKKLNPALFANGSEVSYNEILKLDDTEPEDKGDHLDLIMDIFENVYNLIYQFTDSDDKRVDPIVLLDVRDAIDDKYTGYRYIYDNAVKQVNRIMDSVIANCKEIYELANGNYGKLKSFWNEDYKFVSYVQKDFSADANKYCIYWYRYVPNNQEPSDGIMTGNWQRITHQQNDKNTPLINLGLSGKGRTEGITDYREDGITEYTKEVTYHATSLDAGEGMLTWEMDRVTQKNEKFVVVLFYNHEKVVSNELEFVNETAVADPATIGLTDSIVIEHSDYSQDAYPSYGVDNSLINKADAKRQRKILVRYKGILAGDEALIGAQIFWYVPKNSTMVQYFLEDLSEYGFKNDINDKETCGASREGYTCFYKTIGTKDVTKEDGTKVKELKSEDRYFTYRIKEYYNSNCTNNFITCRVQKTDVAGKTTALETSIIFGFSSYGTSGTDYSLVVQPAGTQAAVTKTNPLLLDVSLYDYNNKEIPLYNEALTSDQMVNSEECGYKAEFKLITPNDKSIYAITKKPSTGVLKQCSIGFIKPGETSNYFGVLETKVHFNLYKNKEEDVEEKEEVAQYRTVTLTNLYPVAYSAGDYYIEGASTVIYNSSGNSPAYYKDPYKVFHSKTKYKEDGITIDVKADTEVKNVTWMIKFFNDNGEIIDLTKDVNENQNLKLYREYLPKLDANNCLIPGNMYLDGIDFYPVVYAYDINDIVLWAQPIILMQNRYVSPMLNSWDGELTIDEENGTILSTIIGAGKKNPDNTFSGVLMGDIKSGAALTPETHSGNHEGLGIYGFHHGAQSFGFNIDGTAFIGKSGQGRLLFDGNKSVIESANYNQFKRGMHLDFDDGLIDIRGLTDYNKGTKEKPQWVNSRITIKENSPYFTIVSKYGNTLMEIGDDEFFLQTDTWDPNNRMGVQFDLQRNKLTGYNFSLWSISTEGSYVKIQSDGSPYLAIFDGKQNIFYAAKNEYYLQSTDYVPNTSGVRFDLATGKITGYNFYIYATGNDGFIQINSGDGTYPLNVNDKFTVDWLGNTSSSGSLTVSGKTTIGGETTINDNLYITGDASLTGTLTVGGSIKSAIAGYYELNSDGAKIAGWTISTDSISSVDNITTLNKSGEVKTANIIATKGSIGGWILEDGNLQGSSKKTTLYGDGTIQSTKFKVDGTTGLLTAENANLTNLIVTETLTVLSTGSATVLQVANTGDLTMTGNLKFNGTITAGPDAKVGYPHDGGYQTINIDIPWAGNTGKATFYNGLLVEWGAIGAGQTFIDWLVDKIPALDILFKTSDEGGGGSGGGTSGSYTKFGDLAFVDDIKKKFNITASGNYGSTLYVTDGTENEITGAWADINIDAEGKYINHTIRYNYGSRTKYKSIGKSVTIKGSTDVTLVPNESGITESIDVSVSGTVSI